MTAAVALDGRFGPGVRRWGYRDPVSGYGVLVTTPDADPQRWREYLAGALRSYRAYGVETVLDFEQMRDGRTSSLLFVVLSDEGETVGGIRVQGPYTDAEESHAVAEWEGTPGQAAVRSMIEQRLQDGVVEMKAAWVADGWPARRELVACLSRTPIHAAAMLGARYAMGTAAEHSVAGWVSAGAVVADVPPVAYPDERYRTSLVWIDREAFSGSLTSNGRRIVDEEAAQLRAPVVPAQAAR